MKRLCLFYSLALLCIVGCNSVPKQSVFEPIDAKKLNALFQKDTVFTSFYEDLMDEISDFNEIEKAKFHDVTYNGLFSMYQYARDTSKVGPQYRKWEKEWKELFGDCADKADALIAEWQQKKIDNSLSRFVSIEFSVLDKDYYSYSHDVKNVNFGFKVTPLDGPIEQFKFTYRYSAKIDKVYCEKHSCICTSPVSYPQTKYWELGYSDEKRLKDKTTSEFIRDYDIDIEVTSVRKDGHNYSIDDLNIPSTIEKVLDLSDGEYPYLRSYYTDKMITDQINPAYKGLSSYQSEQLQEVLKKKYPREFALMDYIDNK